jgi:hypothetical protein
MPSKCDRKSQKEKKTYSICVCKKISDEQLYWISYYSYKYYLQQVVMEIVNKHLMLVSPKKCFSIFFQIYDINRNTIKAFKLL